jgi:hypothetical protein
MDVHAVTVQFWHCEFLQSLWRAYCSAIHPQKGNAAGASVSFVAVAEIKTTFRQKLYRSAQHKFRNFILLDKFQFALPPDWNALILRAADIDPVGAGPLPISELPP